MIQRLVVTARANWDVFDGWSMTVLAGGDPLRLPLDRFLNLVYYWLVKDGDSEGIQKMNLKLWMPPKGEAAPKNSPWSAEAETSAFKAFSAEVQGKVRAKPEGTR